MGSRGAPQRSISELLALSEVDEESYEDLDQLLDTTTIDNDDGEIFSNANHDENDIEKIFDAVDVPAPSPTVPIDNTYMNTIELESTFSSSSPIHSVHSRNDHNPLTAYSDGNNFMSPTTLLNNLLSQGDVDIDRLSVDMYTNANMDLSQSMDITSNNLDTSFFRDVLDDMQPDELDGTLNVMGDHGSDDGMNSFVTAREDGDANSTINSKESTVVTALVINKSSSDEFVYDQDNASIHVPAHEPSTIHKDNDDSDFVTTTMDHQISATVSFHRSTDELERYDPVAPLWDEDPSTPKRSGREIMVQLPNNKSSSENTIATTHDTEMVLQTEWTADQDLNNIVSIDPISDVHPELPVYQPPMDIKELNRMYSSEAFMTTTKIVLEEATLRPLPLDHDLLKTSKKSALDHLSVPTLADDSSSNSYLVINNVRVVYAADATAIENETDKEGQPEVLKIRQDQNELLLTDPAQIITTNFDSRTEKNPILSDDEATTAVHRSKVEHPLYQQSEAGAENGEATNVERKLDSANTSNSDKINVAIFGSVHHHEHLRMSNELKSLQVEFPSRLDKDHKKSDVSLSSASSTISHGSFNKAPITNEVYTPAPLDEQQHRGNRSSESLPPRSPRRTNTPMDNQNTKHFVTSKLLSQNVDNDDNSVERVETKWMKQSFSVRFNPRRSIFAGKQDTKDRSNSISPPGSPPEPCYSDSEDDNVASFHDETRSSSSTSIKMNSTPGPWDMIVDEFSENEFPNKTKYDTHDDGNNDVNQFSLRLDDSVSESSISPSEIEVNKGNYLSAKPSFQSDTSLSSSVWKRRGTNKTLSLSGHSRGSLCSGRSSQERKGNRHLLTPIGRTRHSTLSSRRIDADTSSLGRLSSHAPRSPEPTPMYAMHCSSPDLYKLNEESQSSQQPSPTKIVDGNTVIVSHAGSIDIALIAEAQPSDMISPESLAEKYAKYGQNEIMQYEESAANLEKLLLEFSSIHPLELPFRNIESPLHLKYIGYLRWRQLVACWKHSELFREMASGTSSVHSNEKGYRNDVELYSISSDRYHRNINMNLELDGVSVRPERGKTATRLFNGDAPNKRGCTISSFLSQINSGTFERSSQILRHDISTSTTNEPATKVLHRTAAKNLTMASLIVHDIIAFATMNSSNRNEIETISYSVGVKDQDVINRKAQMKYNGDIFQVKDILRAQITFRNEEELVCGLVRLLQTAKIPTEESTSNSEDITLIRIKNLFSSESIMGAIGMSPLPTGYRHVLLNLRLKDGLIFGTYPLLPYLFVSRYWNVKANTFC
jgi:hypothetical protein